jgi:hypothetical protein
LGEKLKKKKIEKKQERLKIVQREKIIKGEGGLKCCFYLMIKK